MSSMPEGDPARQRGDTQQSAHPGAPQQSSGPSQEEYGGTPYGAVPGQTRGPAPSGNWSGQPEGTSQALRAETRVTGRRVVQYLVDAFLVWLIPALVSIPFDASNSTFLHVLGGIIAFVLFVVIGLVYWVIMPQRQEGQTLGMKLLGLRVISKSGGPANMAQLFIRWICLIFDAIPYGWPFTGLVGFIVILFSKDRQRIGDHLARTLVISTRDDFARGGSSYASPRVQEPYAQPTQPGMQSHESGGSHGQPGPTDMPPESHRR